ncbi:MAG: Asp-tRNA(Asn)/Glu-tRNA(Gln) amidotransferase GatCAB subunit B, partial [Oscillospiraceae bacterium]|nr:Asp-tRNA(Asn)/Glu-tRNA(Gln) amidotransferase GatCAB subunit B [Oscillospiraceae bacterium]
LARYTDICKLSKADALILVKDKALSDLFDDVLASYNSPASVASFILTEFLRRINLGELDINSMAFTAEQFGALVRLSDNEKISKNDAKEVFRIMAEKGGDPEQIAEQKGYIITVDIQRVEAEIGRILSENVSQVQQYRNGEKKVFGFIMGQCTKALRGAATPALIKTVLENKLNEAAVSDGQTQS